MSGRERTTAKKGKSTAKNTARPQGQNSSTPVAVIPVTAEELELTKQRVTTGKVRVTKQVSERVETIDGQGFRDEVEVERVPVDKIEEVLPEMHVEGDTTIIPVVEEVYIVEKRYRVKEEVRVRRKRKEVKSTQQVSLRSEDVKVERVGGNEIEAEG